MVQRETLGPDLKEMWRQREVWTKLRWLHKWQ